MCAFKAIFGAIMLVLSFVAPVAAGPFEDAAAAYSKGDSATALRLFRSLADQGDAKAQFVLGGMYGLGRGVQKNDAEAAKWYRLAADQGDAKAQFLLGGMYKLGQGVPQNDAEAAKWVRLAADQGGGQGPI
jgi:TPR repeat protein